MTGEKIMRVQNFEAEDHGDYSPMTLTSEKMEPDYGPRLLFNCAICQRDIRDYEFRKGRDRHIAPICKYCEGEYGDRAPMAGAFMDRRLAVQVSALANALNSRAHMINWRRLYGH